MTLQHSPGPWLGRKAGERFADTEWNADCHDSSSGRTMFAPILDANGHTVALVVRTDWNDDQLEIDAALLAAAPQLLEALQAMVATDGGSISIAKARAAIQAATTIPARATRSPA